VRSSYEVVVYDILLVAFCLQCGLWGRGLVAFGIGQLVKGKGANDPARTMGSTVLSFVGNVLVWTIVLLSGLQALNFPVSTFIASLGVGGIAVALALQNILGDLFASISILLDKPFVIGDGIQIGEFSGTIERIGVKSTRLRSVNGEEIIMGNHDLVASRIRNFKRSQERRIVLNFGIEYDTEAGLVERVPVMIKAIIEDTPGTRFDRAHFTGFGDSALQMEAVYFSKSPDYVPMMDVQQRVNLALLHKFRAEGIDFAFPTQTVRHVDLMPLAGVGGETRDESAEAVLAQRQMKKITERVVTQDVKHVGDGSKAVGKDSVPPKG
jgi:small-conductance mechanosensitive channel